jgi:hypothetical protein
LHFHFFNIRTGFRSFQRGEKQRSQILMRGRVAAQAFTVIAMGIGAYLGIKPHNRPENMEQKMENMNADIKK